MDTLWQDIRIALRSLGKSPGFVAVAVVTLALGIGFNTAIFSLLDQALLRRLPVKNPQELVVLRSGGDRQGRISSDGDSAQSFSFPMYKALRERNQSLVGLIAKYDAAVSLALAGETERGSAEMVSGNYFEVLGVRPFIGRLFTLADDQVPGGHPVAILSNGYWLRRFGGNPSVLNQSIVVNAHPMTIVGVTQAGFTGVQVGSEPDIFVPLMMKAEMTPNWDDLDNWNSYWLPVLGRLKPGMTIAQATSGLQVTYHGLLAEQVSAAGSKWSDEDRKQFLQRTIELQPGSRGRDTFDRDSGTSILAMFGLVGMVLIIVCTNIASLVMARAAGRGREYAVRRALGAGRGRLIKATLVESVMLSVFGGVLGILVASWGIDGLISVLHAGGGVSGFSSRLDARMLAFNFAVAVGAGTLFGLAPALRFSTGDINAVLRDQGANATIASGTVRTRKIFVTAQVALTVVLLGGAGLFALTLWNLRHVNLGMRTDHLMTFAVAPDLNGYTPERTVDFCNRLSDSLAGLPGVRGASVAVVGVLKGDTHTTNISIEGATNAPKGGYDVSFNWVGPGYFSTLGIPLLEGREFTRADNSTSAKVAIINETSARLLFKGRNPLGLHFGLGSGANVKTDIEIVGVVKDGKYARIRDEATPFAYVPYAQSSSMGTATFYVRTMQLPETMSKSLRDTVRGFDSTLPVFAVRTLEEQVSEDLMGERLAAQLSVGFGILAALLGCIGIYGVLAYIVVQRTREIGIRMALGAMPKNVRWMILREIVVLFVVGAALGLPAAYGLGHVMESALYGVRAGQPAVLMIGPALMAIIAMASGYLPARKAMRIDPMVALRYE